MRCRTPVLGFTGSVIVDGKKYARRASFEVEVSAPSLQRAVFI